MTTRLSFSSTRLLSQIAIAAGMKVSDKMKANTRAMITVSAIGSNILPSTPVKVSNGA